MLRVACFCLPVVVYRFAVVCCALFVICGVAFDAICVFVDLLLMLSVCAVWRLLVIIVVVVCGLLCVVAIVVCRG